MKNFLCFVLLLLGISGLIALATVTHDGVEDEFLTGEGDPIYIADSNTLFAQISSNQVGTNFSALEVTTTDNSATEIIHLTVDPATPANGDEAQIGFRLDPSGAGVVRTFGRIDVALLDVTDGAETAALGLDVWDSDGAGTMIEGFNLIGRTGQDEAIINEAGVDLDFRVEGIGQVNALFVRGSDGNVGIGTGDPTNLLQLSGGVLDMGSSNIVNLRSLLMSDDSLIFVDGTDIFYVSSNGATTNDLTATGIQDIFVHVDLGGVNQLLADSTTVLVLFSNTVENIGGGWTSNRFDVPVNGFYKIKFVVGWTGGLTDQAAYVLNIRTNNAQVIVDDRHTASGAAAQSQKCSIELHLNTDTFVDFAAQQQGTSDSIIGSANFSFVEIRLTRED